MRGALRWIELGWTRKKIAVLTALVILGCISVFRIATTSATESNGGRKQTGIQRARMSEEISVHAAGRGNPWINLSDGHELITPYSGPAELTQILERNQARPLSLCSADFDEDGVPDLISGYAGPNSGIVTMLRGNVDSIYPNAPEAKQRKAEGTFTEAPFLSPAFVFSAPEAADFIGAGDFDGDGHWDVVAAAHGSYKMYLLSGDGKGGLRESKKIDLPGGVTAMVVGEINRRDGLDDVVVGVSGEQGSKALVFEGPEGALRANPEVFELTAEATSLVLGQLDDGYEMDLALAAGHELMIVHGRDRKLSLDRVRQQEVRPAAIDKRIFQFGITSMAIGNFRGTHEYDLALLSDAGTVELLSRKPQVRREKQTSPRPTGGSYSVAISLLAGAWHATEVLRLSEYAASLPQNKGRRLVCARVSSHPVDTLVVVDSPNRQVQILDQTLDVVARPKSKSVAHHARAALDLRGEPTALLGSGHQFTGLIPVPLAPTIQVLTDNNGNAGFMYSFQIPDGFGGTGFVNATATNSTGNTSEFSECISVTSSTAAPTITSACKGEGKLLFIFGSGFVEGAKVWLKSEAEGGGFNVEKKTLFVSSTQLIAFKAGKRTFTGDKLKVRNPDAEESTEFTYTQLDCPQ